MPFVQRDQLSKIIGLFANRQPGYAEEELPHDDPEVMAYLSPPPVDQADIDQLQKQMKAVLLCVAQVGGLTVPQIEAMFRNKMESLP